MKPTWKVQRTVAARDDGQRRWDYAYQFLLQWATDLSAETCSADASVAHCNRNW